MQIPTILGDGIQTLRLVICESLVGGAAIVVCVAIGWCVGGERQARFVRLVSWWLDHVVRPLLGRRSWFQRTVIIAANNSLVCAAVVVLGAVGSLSWLGVVFVGLGLGVALRLLLDVDSTDQNDVDAEPGAQDERDPGDGAAEPRLRWLATIGLALNLLEIPAIMFSAGLSLGQGSISSVLSLRDALIAFASIVMPVLIVSAAGEALWMTLDPRLSRRMQSGDM